MKKTVLAVQVVILLYTGISSCTSLKSGSQSEQMVKPDNNPISNNEDIHHLDDPNKSPESVMQTIFQSAKTGEVGILKLLLPPKGEGETDADCIALCNPGNESMRAELDLNYISLHQFEEAFSNAKIIGIPVIDGNEAKVNFVFGPNLEVNETMFMQKINGKWYLRSF